MNGDSARHASLHGKIGSGGNGALQNFRATGSHELFVGGHHGFLVSNRRIDDFGGHGCAAHQFHHDVQVWTRYQFPPIFRFENWSERLGTGF